MLFAEATRPEWGNPRTLLQAYCSPRASGLGRRGRQPTAAPRVPPERRVGPHGGGRPKRPVGQPFIGTSSMPRLHAASDELTRVVAPASGGAVADLLTGLGRLLGRGGGKDDAAGEVVSGPAASSRSEAVSERAEPGLTSAPQIERLGDGLQFNKRDVVPMRRRPRATDLQCESGLTNAAEASQCRQATLFE